MRSRPNSERYTLGIDTSNYATSLAVFDTAGEVVCAKKRFLPVKAGQLGLRQSDALFHHTVALPEMMQELAQEFDLTQIDAVGVSQKPRPVEGSYMPCFLAGVNAATAFAHAKGIPLVLTTHQRVTLPQRCLQLRGTAVAEKFCCSIFPAAPRTCCSAIRCAGSQRLAPAQTFMPDRLWTVWGSGLALASRRVPRFPVWLHSALRRSSQNPA